MRSLFRTFSLLALLLPVAGTLAAQHRGLRPVEHGRDGDGSGFWAVVGLAAGKERYKFDDDAQWSEAFESGSFMLAAGGQLAPDVTVGFEWNVWSDYEADSDQRLHALSLVGNWYPGGSLLFLKGGLGLGFNRIDDATGTFKDTGVGLTVGAGVDIPISRRVAIQPRIDSYFQRYDDEGQANDYRERLTQIGVAIRFR
jgi:hypothetical protein